METPGGAPAGCWGWGGDGAAVEPELHPVLRPAEGDRHRVGTLSAARLGAARLSLSIAPRMSS